MRHSARPIVCTIPEDEIRRFRLGTSISRLQVTPIDSPSIDEGELERLLGPLSEYEQRGHNDNFEIWLAKPEGCINNVMIWSLKKKHAKYQRLLRDHESLILISAAYSRVDRDEADFAAILATVKLVIALGGRDVTKRSTLYAEIKENLFHVASLFLPSWFSWKRKE